MAPAAVELAAAAKMETMVAAITAAAVILAITVAAKMETLAAAAVENRWYRYHHHRKVSWAED